MGRRLALLLRSRLCCRTILVSRRIRPGVVRVIIALVAVARLSRLRIAHRLRYWTILMSRRVRPGVVRVIVALVTVAGLTWLRIVHRLRRWTIVVPRRVRPGIVRVIVFRLRLRTVIRPSRLRPIARRGLAHRCRVGYRMRVRRLCAWPIYRGLSDGRFCRRRLPHCRRGSIYRAQLLHLLPCQGLARMLRHHLLLRCKWNRRWRRRHLGNHLTVHDGLRRRYYMGHEAWARAGNRFTRWGYSHSRGDRRHR